jgi:hypothetical protein
VPFLLAFVFAQGDERKLESLRRRNEGLRRELELLQDQMDAKLTTLRWQS